MAYAAEGYGDILPAVHLVDRRHPLGGRRQFVLPKHRAGVGITGTELAISGSADKQKPASGATGPPRGVWLPTPVMPWASSVMISPLGIDHSLFPVFMS